MGGRLPGACIADLSKDTSTTPQRTAAVVSVPRLELLLTLEGTMLRLPQARQTGSHLKPTKWGLHNIPQLHNLKKYGKLDTSKMRLVGEVFQFSSVDPPTLDRYLTTPGVLGEPDTSIVNS